MNHLHGAALILPGADARVRTYAQISTSPSNQHQHWSCTSKQPHPIEAEYAWLAAEVNDNQVGLQQQQQQEIDHS